MLLPDQTMEYVVFIMLIMYHIVINYHILTRFENTSVPSQRLNDEHMQHNIDENARLTMSPEQRKVSRCDFRARMIYRKNTD